MDGIIHTRSARDVSKVKDVHSKLFDSEKRFHRLQKRDGGTINERDDVKKDCDVDKFESLNIGCTGTSDTMEFYSSCGSESNSGMESISQSIELNLVYRRIYLIKI